MPIQLDQNQIDDLRKRGPKYPNSGKAHPSCLWCDKEQYGIMDRLNKNLQARAHSMRLKQLREYGATKE